MSVYILIGSYKDQALQTKSSNRPGALIIPNLNPTPVGSTSSDEIIKRFRMSMETEIYISTDNTNFVNSAIPNEIFICSEEECKRLTLLKIYPAFKAALDTGFQSMSEILISQGIWQ